jgi:ADP-heptose:LPS heptosyltransferase
MVSQSFLQPLFEHCPDNVRFIGVDLYNDYKGVPGMYRLYRELLKQKFDAVADLHDVLRTKLLRIFFRCSGLTVRHINKGRKDKRKLTKEKDKLFYQLKPTTERYADVFRALGLNPATCDFHSIFGSLRGEFSRIEPLTGKKTGVWIGIAPFAKHEGKIFPLNRMEQVVTHFANKEDITLFLFGGGTSEQTILEEWHAKYPQTVLVAGKLKLSDELILMSHLDVMLSMDSANMHLASLTATPVVSVWGATHPYSGFYGYSQSPENAVQVELSCRPCSVYGSKPCYRNNTECMRKITPQMVIEKLEKGRIA